MDSDQIKLMGLSMFLGLSCGKWYPEHTPTLENPSLLLKYKGKEQNGRPMKLLNAAARPPKKFRFTQYFNKSICNLTEQSIELCELKAGVDAKDVVDAYQTCVEHAQQIILYRQKNAIKAQRIASDPNKELRKTVKRLAKQLLGEAARIAVSKNETGEVEVRIFDSRLDDNKFGVTIKGANEKAALLDAIVMIPELEDLR